MDFTTKNMSLEERYDILNKLEKQYTETEIREIYKNNPDVEYINIAK